MSVGSAAMVVPIIVLIDDNPDEVRILDRTVANLPYPAVLLTAPSVLDGLMLTQRQVPHVRVILLDLHMPPPQPDGWWAITELRRLAPGAWVIPYTADHTASERLAELGLEIILYKPASPDQIQQVLLRALTTPIPQQPPAAPPVSHLYDFLKEQSARVLRQAQGGYGPISANLRD